MTENIWKVIIQEKFGKDLGGKVKRKDRGKLEKGQIN